MTLSPGQTLAAPQPQRLLATPPPRVVADAVPLDVEALEHAAQHARHRPVTTDAFGTREGPSTADLLTIEPTPLPATPRPALATPTSAAGPALDDDLDAALDLFALAGDLPSAPAAPAPATPSAPLSANAGLAAAALSSMSTTGSTMAVAPRPTVLTPLTAAADADAATATMPALDAAPLRRRPAATLVGAVLAFAGVSVGTAMWVQQHRDTPTAAPAASISTTVPATTAAPAIGASASTTPASAPVTTTPVPVTTPPSTAVAATQAVTPASSLPATTEAPATTAAVEPATSTATSVLGTTVLNRELLDGLGKGQLTGGQAWPKASFVEGKIVLTGVVPTEQDQAVAVATAGGLLTPDAVVNQLTIDPSAQSVRYLIVQLFDNPMFDRGSSKTRKDSEPVFELWAQRLRQKPASTVLLLAHGDGAVSSSSNLAASRARAAGARMLASEGVAADRFQAVATAGGATGPRLDFAIPMT